MWNIFEIIVLTKNIEKNLKMYNLGCLNRVEFELKIGENGALKQLKICQFQVHLFSFL